MKVRIRIEMAAAVSSEELAHLMGTVTDWLKAEPVAPGWFMELADSKGRVGRVVITA